MIVSKVIVFRKLGTLKGDTSDLVRSIVFNHNFLNLFWEILLHIDLFATVFSRANNIKKNEWLEIWSSDVYF